jgi:hypothetical protein
MKHYIDTDNKVWGFDETQSDLIPAGLLEIPATYSFDKYPYLSAVNGVVCYNATAHESAESTEKVLSCKLKAQSILNDTDWVTLSDVTTGSPRLINQTEFLTYRNTVRALVVTPVAEPVWPVKPTAVWDEVE